MRINGKEVVFDKPITILELLKGYKLSRHVVVMHVNGEIIPTDQYGTTYLGQEDEVQLTSIVGGG